MCLFYGMRTARIVLQRGGCVIYAILVLAASVPLVRGPEQGRRQLALHYHFRESLQSGGSNQVHRSDSVQSAAGCSGGVPWGRPSGFVDCKGKAASLPEPPARTFERVPGENSPSLFAAVVKVRVAGSPDKGIFEVALLNRYCPWWKTSCCRWRLIFPKTFRSGRELARRYADRKPDLADTLPDPQERVVSPPRGDYRR